MNLKVHLQNFSKFSTRAGCGGVIYLGITREAPNIFYGFVLLMKGIFLLAANIIFLKRENTEPVLTIKII